MVEVRRPLLLALLLTALTSATHDDVVRSVRLTGDIVGEVVGQGRSSDIVVMTTSGHVVSVDADFRSVSPLEVTDDGDRVTTLLPLDYGRWLACSNTRCWYADYSVGAAGRGASLSEVVGSRESLRIKGLLGIGAGSKAVVTDTGRLFAIPYTDPGYYCYHELIII